MKKSKKTTKKGEIVIYQAKSGPVEILADINKNTFWLTQQQVGELFQVQKAAISKHVSNIFKSGELNKKSTVSILEIVQKEGARLITRSIEHYNLDLVVSIGYRVNSTRATQFRIWATKVLREHIIKGYTINKQRLPKLEDKQLNELEQTVGLIKKTLLNRQLSSFEESGLLRVITDYANTWVLLQKYDEAKLALPSKTKSVKAKLSYDLAVEAISGLKKDLLDKKQATGIFGQEREHGLEQIVMNLEQSFGGVKLYPSVEQQAAHLLYFVIKDHPFVDGNKRIASFLFVLFLARNKALVKNNGEKKISDYTLVALALLIAESDPKQKDIMVKLIMNFL